jgi:hypothetical protein
MKGDMRASSKLSHAGSWALAHLATVVLIGVLAFVGGCSGAKSRKAPGPADSETKGSPCTTECCCRSDDGYYRRHQCLGAADCAAIGGECLEAATPRCRH